MAALAAGDELRAARAEAETSTDEKVRRETLLISLLYSGP